MILRRRPRRLRAPRRAGALLRSRVAAAGPGAPVTRLADSATSPLRAQATSPGEPLTEAITAEGEDAAPEALRSRRLQQRLQRRQRHVLLGDQQVELLLLERDEVQPHRRGRRVDAEPAVRQPALHRHRHRPVRVLLAPVAAHLLRRDPRLCEPVVEEHPRARPLLPVHETHVRPAKIAPARDPLRVARGDHQPLLAPDETDLPDRPLPEVLGHVGAVVGPARRVDQVRCRQVGHAVAQGEQPAEAPRRRSQQRHAAGAQLVLEHVDQQVVAADEHHGALQVGHLPDDLDGDLRPRLEPLDRLGDHDEPLRLRPGEDRRRAPRERVGEGLPTDASEPHPDEFAHVQTRRHRPRQHGREARGNRFRKPQEQPHQGREKKPRRDDRRHRETGEPDDRLAADDAERRRFARRDVDAVRDQLALEFDRARGEVLRPGRGAGEHHDDVVHRRPLADGGAQAGEIVRDRLPDDGHPARLPDHAGDDLGVELDDLADFELRARADQLGPGRQDEHPRTLRDGDLGQPGGQQRPDVGRRRSATRRAAPSRPSRSPGR